MQDLNEEKRILLFQKKKYFDSLILMQQAYETKNNELNNEIDALNKIQHNTRINNRLKMQINNKIVLIKMEINQINTMVKKINELLKPVNDRLIDIMIYETFLE